VDETPLPGERPQVYTLRLAAAKAHRLQQAAGPGRLILAADTTVADGDTLLGKPANPEQARRMLGLLRGRTHQVCTAIAVLDPATGRLETDLCISQVPMRAYTAAEMDAYIATGDPLDKAGAYAIQNSAFQPVTDFKGCFASVMGLPLCHAARTFKKFEIAPPEELPRACQAALQYACPIYKAVWRGEHIG
jgi:septum formation protein